jgi:ketosteroid isomerase-like protein
MADSPFESPDAVEDAFYRAFANTDLGGMARVWSGGDEARCIHPGGDLLTGPAAVLQSWRQIFSAAVAPTVRYRLLHRAAAGDLSIHLVEERIGPGDASDAQLTRVLATNIYRRTPNGWRMVLHHATLPLTEERGGHPRADGAADADRLH